jgi:hypothetical protein
MSSIHYRTPLKYVTTPVQTLVHLDLAANIKILKLLNYTWNLQIFKLILPVLVNGMPQMKLQ